MAATGSWAEDLNGLLLEKLEHIPEPGTALRIGGYEFEILQTLDNSIRTVRMREAATAQPSA
jgi:Mg2+/Co2+ transporter CorB